MFCIVLQYFYTNYYLYLFIYLFFAFLELVFVAWKELLGYSKIAFLAALTKKAFGTKWGDKKIGANNSFGKKGTIRSDDKWSVRLVLIMIHWAQQRDRSLAVLNRPRMRVFGAASLCEQQGRGSILWLENLLSLTCQFYCFHEQWRLKKDLEYKQGEKCFITSSIHLSREWKTHPDFKQEHELLLSSRSPAFILYLSLPKPCGIRWWVLHL